ncbi:conserved cytoplasmic hypothetical protein [Candidatus Glomeribacter gigasporarum BEG34]|uniref:Uncharacterized protein n=1 Tax=Candidatus Glomeribacter gigasporarum BEG34 TaxID=1070319 RepID=G2JA00_9BURK|nr:hypothetical protein [Candidatus Glomeribacter gigasporarum]CCD29597.1 conserved cytoplasmic hypothetical protein [Candidatus Glomeribacter gigasporarum BEG34]
MKTATIRIRKDTNAVLREAAQRFKQVWKTGQPQGACFTFSTAEQLFRTVTPKRWALLEKLQAIGPISLRGLARELERDVKRVHEDTTVLQEVGLIERDERRKLIVPYRVIHIDFDLEVAA